MQALAIFFGGCGIPQPAWLQTEDPMKGFNKNLLKYGQDRTRGKGIWAFYNEDTQILRVFSWQGQHLKQGDIEQALIASKTN